MRDWDELAMRCSGHRKHMFLALSRDHLLAKLQHLNQGLPLGTYLVANPTCMAVSAQQRTLFELDYLGMSWSQFSGISIISWHKPRSFRGSLVCVLLLAWSIRHAAIEAISSQ